MIDSKFSIGVPEMDRQHEEWIVLIDKFRAIGSEKLMEPTGIELAASVLKDLLSYTKFHFTSEEKFLEKHGYPGLLEHKRLHRHLEAMVTKLLAEITKTQLNHTPLKLNLLATIWLLEHIMNEDAQYGKFIEHLKQAELPGHQSGTHARLGTGGFRDK